MREHEQGDLFYHDVPRALAGQARRKTRAQSATPGHSPWPLAAWLDVPTKFVLCTEDRFFPPSSCTASSPTASASPPTRSPPVIARRSAVRRNWSTCSPDTPLHKPVWNRDKAELLTCGLQVSGGSQEVRKIRWRWVRDSARVFVRVQALGCPVGCMRRALVRLVLVLPVLLAAAVLGAVSAVSGLAKRPRSGLALTQRTRPRSSCSTRTSPSLEVIRAYAVPGSRGHARLPLLDRWIPPSALARGWPGAWAVD